MGLFGRTPKVPEPEPPTPLPNEDDIRTAERRQLARAQKRGGIQSTVLSRGTRETLGS